MKTLWSVLGISGKVAIMVMMATSFLVQAGNVSADEAKSDFKYIGSMKCKICHKKESDGAQYTKWQSTGHAHAYETLGTPEAAEIAKARGISGSPQEAPECMKCHSTAWGMSAEALAASKITLEEGVSCESCHGPGSGYYKKKTMEKITAGTIDGTTLGLTMPTEAVCVACHNDESPGFKGFDFKEFFPKIAHPKPKQDAADE